MTLAEWRNDVDPRAIGFADQRRLARLAWVGDPDDLPGVRPDPCGEGLAHIPRVGRD